MTVLISKRETGTGEEAPLRLNQPAAFGLFFTLAGNAEACVRERREAPAIDRPVAGEAVAEPFFLDPLEGLIDLIQNFLGIRCQP